MSCCKQVNPPLLDLCTLTASSVLISTILRHDAKQTSYKIALLRAINDVALSYPDLRHSAHDIAVPLRLIAAFWLAYYWPFMDEQNPILQGARTRRGEGLRHDVSFRPALTDLKQQWRALTGTARPSDGFVLTHDLKLPRKRAGYPAPLLAQYEVALKQLVTAIKQPLQYAGEGAWSVFARPKKLTELPQVTAVPGTLNTDLCLIVTRELWRSFQELSLWIEALCVHEWCLFSEGVEQPVGRRADRGEVYRLLTERPDNRRPLTWERNQIELLMLEGYAFTCPWSLKRLTPEHYALDHIVPLSVYPINELWNLVPSDPRTNTHFKRARVPSPERWHAATPHLAQSYRGYAQGAKLAPALEHDVAHRFSRLHAPLMPERITDAVGDFVRVISRARNLATF